jgi:uncharacterized protein
MFTLKILRFYQKKISPVIHYIFPFAGCRFTPTCSEYTFQAVGRYGTIKGLFLGLGRIIRCNPFNKGGYDPVK